MGTQPYKAASPLTRTTDLYPAEPLWQRAPSRDHQGRPLSDFLMIIPGLRSRPAARVRDTVSSIQAVLARYGRVVVFADLNLRLNTLWVTVRPVPGICLELPAVIKHHVPEALLVAHRQE